MERRGKPCLLELGYVARCAPPVGSDYVQLQDQCGSGLWLFRCYAWEDAIPMNTRGWLYCSRDIQRRGAIIPRSEWPEE